jgi:WD40 repeat protein
MRLLLSFLFFLTHFFAAAQLPKLVVPIGHTNPVIGLATDPSNTYLYSIDGGSDVTVWDIRTKTVITFLEGHSGAITSISASADGKYLATADASGKIVIRHQSDWKIAGIADVEGSVTQIQFDAEGKLLGTLTTTGKLSVITANKPQEAYSVELKEKKITSFTWNAAGKLALGCDDGTLGMRQQGGEVATIVTNSAKAVTGIMPGVDENSWVYVAGDGEVFRLQNGQIVSQFKSPLPRIISLHASKDLLMLTGRGSARNVHFYPLSGGEEVSDQIQIPTALLEQSGSAIGLQTAIFSANGRELFLPDYQGGIHAYDLTTGKYNGAFVGLASKILSLAINKSGTQLAVGRNDGVVLFDLTGATAPKQLKTASAPVIGLAFGTNQYLLAGVQQNGTVSAWDTKYDAVVYSRATGEQLTYPYLEVTSDDQRIIKKVDNGTGIFSIKSGKKPKIIKLKESFDQRLTPDGKLLLAQDASAGITFYDTENFKKQNAIKIEGLQYFEVSADGKWIGAVVKNKGTSLQLIDMGSGKTVKKIAVPDGKTITRLKFDPTGKHLVTLSKVISKGSSQGDYSITFWDLEKGAEAFQLKGHSAAVSGLAFSSSGEVLFSSGFDGLIKCWSLSDKKELATLTPLSAADWAVVAGDGLFDASREAISQMHYSVGKESIALEQMKDKFYEPYLLPKLLGFHTDPIRLSPKLDGFDLYPEIKLAHPEQNNGKLGINLNDQGGGIGRIVIFINGKEVINESRDVSTTTDGFASFDYGIENHPYIKKGGLNKITVKAYNQDGYLSSPEKSVYLIDENKVGGATPPKVYGIVAGVSDYQGNDMDLKYAAKDAEDFYNAIKLSSESRFGKENVSIKLLSTLPGFDRPTKANLVSEMAKIKNVATSNDYLVVYLSGHGVADKGDDADFYYLTADASSMNVSETKEKASYSLSSREIGKLIMEVPTIRQVLIIDACHSGQLAQNLSGSTFTMSSEEVRALETLKDRTGLYIIAGSAADAVSYEASAFDQGLLTYSLLYGMKGPALREDRYIDIISLFNFASQKVPELASEIGGIQKPEVRVPNDLNTFDIGELNGEQRKQIALKANRPAVAASLFQNEASFIDDLQLGELIDQRLKKLEGQNSQAGVMFVDVKTFPEAYVIRGRYSEDGESISAVGAVFQGKRKIADLEVSSKDANELADMIISKAQQSIK